MIGRLEAWRQRARQLQSELYALVLAYRDPRTPWYARLVAACVVAYALSPLDLVPDFIPVLGYLDDLILLPLGVALALRLIPAQVMAESRALARERLAPGVSRAGAVAVVIVWLLLAALGILLAVRLAGAG